MGCPVYVKRRPATGEYNHLCIPENPLPMPDKFVNALVANLLVVIQYDEGPLLRETVAHIVERFTKVPVGSLELLTS